MLSHGYHERTHASVCLQRPSVIIVCCHSSVTLASDAISGRLTRMPANGPVSSTSSHLGKPLWVKSVCHPPIPCPPPAQECQSLPCKHTLYQAGLGNHRPFLFLAPAKYCSRFLFLKSIYIIKSIAGFWLRMSKCVPNIKLCATCHVCWDKCGKIYHGGLTEINV